ncbi:class I SAM-dependent methyltransferase [uncultured Desulfobacter sp.]|uniref:class I SAM-dependent methyltransferase n=1 Tax=uncultured Desulfobacter sp. TaxID=240139 RepID=UPI002AABF6DB|nr:class I SAM-dependent methyltransferase [uncultured Desulfobacter sp.]
MRNNHKRFAFGKNWQAFSERSLTKERFQQFKDSFKALMHGIDMQNKEFIDIGFGQGLALISALQMGANVTGIDIDENNIQALENTCRKIGCHKTPEHRICSILNDSFVESNKHQFDIVHSWGVLHHTGNMSKALENGCRLVAKDGLFICSIYNKHWSSPIWNWIKLLYNRSPGTVKKIFILFFYPILLFAKIAVTRKNPYKKERGMDFYYDVVDWVGGYPYEYASINDMLRTVQSKGFRPIRVNPAIVPTGCNEFVFKKE